MTSIRAQLDSARLAHDGGVDTYVQAIALRLRGDRIFPGRWGCGMSLQSLLTKVDGHKKAFDARRRRTKTLYYCFRVGALLLSAVLVVLLLVPPDPATAGALYFSRLGVAIAIALLVALDQIWAIRARWTLQASTTNTLRALRTDIEYCIADKAETQETLGQFRDRLQTILDSANLSLEGVSADHGFVLMTQESVQRLSKR